MRIGESLVNEKQIAPDVIGQVLAVQRREVSVLLGEIIVEMSELSKADLEKHVEAYFIMCKESVMNETSKWLGQDEVDNLSSQFFEPGII